MDIHSVYVAKVTRVPFLPLLRIQRHMTRIKVPWVAEPCRFAKSCRFYRSDSHTCNDDEEAMSYCGYSLHWN